MHLTLAQNAVRETRPEAVVPVAATVNGDENFVTSALPGDWLRVFPANGRDVDFLRFLEHRVDKFAPAKGGGVLIARRCLPTVVH